MPSVTLKRWVYFTYFTDKWQDFDFCLLSETCPYVLHLVWVSEVFSCQNNRDYTTLSAHRSTRLYKRCNLRFWKQNCMIEIKQGFFVRCFLTDFELPSNYDYVRAFLSQKCDEAQQNALLRPNKKYSNVWKIMRSWKKKTLFYFGKKQNKTWNKGDDIINIGHYSFVLCRWNSHSCNILVEESKWKFTAWLQMRNMVS